MQMCPSNASIRKTETTKSSVGCETRGNVSSIRLIYNTQGAVRYILPLQLAN